MDDDGRVEHRDSGGLDSGMTRGIRSYTSPDGGGGSTSSRYVGGVADIGRIVGGNAVQIFNHVPHLLTHIWFVSAPPTAGSTSSLPMAGNKEHEHTRSSLPAMGAHHDLQPHALPEPARALAAARVRPAPPACTGRLLHWRAPPLQCSAWAQIGNEPKHTA